jgi:hypothetical protein
MCMEIVDNEWTKKNRPQFLRDPGGFKAHFFEALFFACRLSHSLAASFITSHAGLRSSSAASLMPATTSASNMVRN